MFPKCPRCGGALRPSWHKGAHDCQYCGRRFLREGDVFTEVARPRSELGAYLTRRIVQEQGGKK